MPSPPLVFAISLPGAIFPGSHGKVVIGAGQMVRSTLGPDLHGRLQIVTLRATSAGLATLIGAAHVAEICASAHWSLSGFRAVLERRESTQMPGNGSGEGSCDAAFHAGRVPGRSLCETTMVTLEPFRAALLRQHGLRDRGHARQRCCLSPRARGFADAHRCPGASWRKPCLRPRWQSPRYTIPRPL